MIDLVTEGARQATDSGRQPKISAMNSLSTNNLRVSGHAQTRAEKAFWTATYIVGSLFALVLLQHGSGTVTADLFHLAIVLAWLLAVVLRALHRRIQYVAAAVWILMVWVP